MKPLGTVPSFLGMNYLELVWINFAVVKGFSSAESAAQVVTNRNINASRSRVLVMPRVIPRSAGGAAYLVPGIF